MAVKVSVQLTTGNSITWVAESASFDRAGEGVVTELPEGAQYTVDYINPDSVAAFTTAQIIPGAEDDAPVSAE